MSYHFIYPPTPAASRGSASEEALLATRGAVLHCHGVWGLRQGPWTRADGRKKQSLKLVSRQFRKQRLAVWAAGRGPDPSFTAMVFEACDRVQKATFGSMGCRPRARSVLHCHGVWGLRQGPWTRADGRKQQGLKLVSRQFRKQRLAVWAAGRGPDPSFTAMVFEACDRVLGLELTAGNSKVWS